MLIGHLRSFIVSNVRKFLGFGGAKRLWKHCPLSKKKLESDLPLKGLGFRVALIVEVTMLSSIIRDCYVTF
jgi:hypothetical protein